MSRNIYICIECEKKCKLTSKTVTGKSGIGPCFHDESRSAVWMEVTEKQEESELMTFIEASKKMKVGDIFSPSSSDYDDFYLFERDIPDGKMEFFGCSGDEGGQGLEFGPDTFALEGKIIPAMPEILNAEELIKYIESSFDEKTTTHEKKLSFIAGGEINGQLMERKNHKELIDVIKDVIQHIFDTGTMNMTKEGYVILIRKIEKNLKPLEK